VIRTKKHSACVFFSGQTSDQTTGITVFNAGSIDKSNHLVGQHSDSGDNESVAAADEEQGVEEEKNAQVGQQEVPMVLPQDSEDEGDEKKNFQRVWCCTADNVVTNEDEVSPCSGLTDERSHQIEECCKHEGVFHFSDDKKKP